MSKYKVIETFVDLQDENYRYNVGDTFPHDGIVVSEKRINDLSGKNNRRKKALIEKVDAVIDVETAVAETVDEIVSDEVAENIVEEVDEAEVEIMNEPEPAVEAESAVAEEKTTRKNNRGKKQK